MEHIEITEEMLDRAEFMFYMVDGNDVDSSYSTKSKVWHIIRAAVFHASKDEMTYSPSFP
jgi:hypothetical protein